MAKIKKGFFSKPTGFTGVGRALPAVHRLSEPFSDSLRGRVMGGDDDGEVRSHIFGPVVQYNTIQCKKERTPRTFRRRVFLTTVGIGVTNNRNPATTSQS